MPNDLTDYGNTAKMPCQRKVGMPAPCRFLTLKIATWPDADVYVTIRQDRPFVLGAAAPGEASPVPRGRALPGAA
ncbi:hypothetical protein, partial [Actinomadura miaoliensis]|uniref:hypothetical protein n=1 Tax=Actinomadura miaoliensis TaxID=430685 RepID=UPI0031EC24CD